MANVLHSALTGAELHEPKGADSALSGQLYKSDGAGSGSWSHDFQRQVISVFIPGENTTTRTTTEAEYNVYIRVPYACTINNIYVSADLPYLTLTSIGSQTITTYNHAGSALTGGAITVAAGNVGSNSNLTPSGNNTFAAGELLRVRRSLGSSSSRMFAWNVQIELTRTA